MKSKLAVLALISVFALVAACNGAEPVPTTDSKVVADQGVGEGGTTTEGTSTARDYVIMSFKLPNTNDKAKNLGYDIDNDSKSDNAFGAILTAIHDAAQGVDMEAVINQNILNGNDIGLLRLMAADFSNDKSAKLQGWTGDRETCCTSKPCQEADVTKTCFSGTYSFKIDSASPTDATVSGTITAGEFDLGGTMEMELPIGMNRAKIKLLAAKFTGKIGADGITEGKIMGAISQNDIKNSLIPAVAKTLDHEMNDPTTSQATKDALKKVFDKDNDGKISTQEVSDNSAVQALLSGDVDADKDGKKEELSLGLGFTAVGAKIGGAK